MICVVVLQNWMGYVDGETGSYSETCVTFDVDGSEENSIAVEEAIDVKEEHSIKVEEALDIKDEVSIKVEEPIDIKDETPVAITIPSMKSEPEVRLWCVCEVVAANALRPFIAQNRKW